MSEDKKLIVPPFGKDDIIAIVNTALKEGKIVILPPLPSDAEEKTYALQAVNGVLDWVEVTASEEL